MAAGVQRSLRGWRPDRPDHRDRVVSAVTDSARLPPTADLRKHALAIRDQGEHSSCVWNAAAAGMGYLYQRAGVADPQMSRMFGYWYTRKLEGTPPSEDSGCEIRDAMKVLAERGVCFESSWPYVDANLTAEPSEAAQLEARDHQSLIYVRLRSLRTIKASIVQGFPPVGGFSVYENYMREECERTGRVAYPEANERCLGGHAVLFVGFDDYANELVFQNSYGRSWGDQGYGRLPYRYLLGGLADDFWSQRLMEM